MLFDANRPLPVARSVEFLAAAWLAVATALLCALLPAGPPRTVAIGSAFNPATTVEAVRTTSAYQRYNIDHQRLRDEHDGPPEIDGAIAPVPITETVVLPVASIVPDAIIADRRPSAAHLIAHQPRGPPLA